MNKIVQSAPSDLSLRDYFIAHAPAEPQQWFRAVMPTERPKQPPFPERPTGSEREIDHVREFRDVMRPDEIKSPELRAYVEALKEGRKLASEWDAEAMKQRYVQWPAAWADEMLARRSA